MQRPCPLYLQKRTFGVALECPLSATSGQPAMPTNIPLSSERGRRLNGASGRIIGPWARYGAVAHVASSGSLLFWIDFLGVKVPQQLYWADDSTLPQGPPNIWTPTEGMRLLASRGP
jgi:hypothetical protein